MIIKVIQFQKRRKSSLRSLAKYMLNPQGKEHRVGEVNMLNMLSKDPMDGVTEMELTQMRNTRAQSPDVMHLVISFPAGEKPSADVLTMIQARILNSLGMSEHQCLTASHIDTDHFHVHMAINKIHPKTFNLIDPYQSWNKLAQCCIDCERDYGLLKDNHVVNRILYTEDGEVIEDYISRDDNYIRNQKARDMDFRIESESLTRFVKDNLKQPLYDAKSWEEIHKMLASNGLKIREQGNGLVIQSVASGINVKLSSISRGLSKNQLVEKLGVFKEPSIDILPKPVRHYRNESLYRQYREERANENPMYSAQYQRILDKSKKIRENIWKTYKHGLVQGELFLSKRDLYDYRKKLREIKNNELAKLDKEIKEELKALRESRPKRCGYVEWLQQQANNGNTEALLELRKRTEIKIRQESKFVNMVEIAGEAPHKLYASTPQLKIDSVTKSGTVIYNLNDTPIRDTGNLLHIDDECSPQTLQSVLLMAKEKFQGSPLTINGNPAFKTQIVIAASLMNEELTFADKELQSTYLRLKEAAYAERRQGKFGLDARPARGSHGGTRSQPSVWSRAADKGLGELGVTMERQERNKLRDYTKLAGRVSNNRLYTDPVSLARNTRAIKYPDPNEVASNPQSRERASLAKLSIRSPKVSDEAIYRNVQRRRNAQLMHEMPVVVVADRSMERQEGIDRSMLGTDVGDRLHKRQGENRGRGPSVRHVDERRRSTQRNAGLIAAEALIAERNAKREIIPSILPHRLFREGETGEFLYGGMRHLNGATVVLLKKADEVVVKPILHSEVKAYKEQKVNASITMKSSESLTKTKARGR